MNQTANQDHYTGEPEIDAVISDAVESLNHREPKFTEDWRKDNPGLHMLYVKSALEHLTAIDLAIARFDSFSNLNMMDPIAALGGARSKLVNTNAAYYDASTMIDSIEKTRRLQSGETRADIERRPYVVYVKRSEMTDDQKLLVIHCDLNARVVNNTTVVEIAGPNPTIYVIEEDVDPTNEGEHQ